MWHGQYDMGISYEAFHVWYASQKSERLFGFYQQDREVWDRAAYVPVRLNELNCITSDTLVRPL
jgi:hypothetical protein